MTDKNITIEMEDTIRTLDKNYVKFENEIIHLIIDNNYKVFFNANQTAYILGYKRPKETIKEIVDKTDKIYLKDIDTEVDYELHPQTLYLTEAGLYKLILKSQLPTARKFKNWVTEIVLPSIRKYGYYKLKTENDLKITKIMQKINDLENENRYLKNDMKKEKFPNGALVYVLDYSEDGNQIYRIGMTQNLNKRLKIYDTHTLHKRKVVFKVEHSCPFKLETCVRALLYDYRYKNKFDFYECDIKIVKKAFDECIKSISCLENQKGGYIDDLIVLNIQYKELQNTKKYLKSMM